MSEVESLLEQLVADAPVERSSWSDVLARARRARRRRHAAAVAAAAALALAVPTFGIGGRLHDLFAGEPVDTHQFSPEQLRVLGAMTAGVQPRLPASAQATMSRVGAANLRLIATRGGSSYYVADRAGGGHCLTINRAGDRHPFSGYLCSPDFPSPKMPIADESVFGRGSVAAPIVTRLEGFAADGVAEIELVTVDGERVSTAVEDNVYLRTDDLPNSRVREIRALRSDGSELYRLCLVRGCEPG